MATRCLALALAPEIRVNAVAPGILEPPGAARPCRSAFPQGRFGTHAEAVEAVLFLAAARLATRRAKCWPWTAGGRWPRCRLS